jgi:hypothetical protein
MRRNQIIEVAGCFDSCTTKKGMEKVETKKKLREGRAKSLGCPGRCRAPTNEAVQKRAQARGKKGSKV